LVEPGSPSGVIAFTHGQFLGLFLKKSLEGERVGSSSTSSGSTPFGRTLAYVWLGEELFQRDAGLWRLRIRHDLLAEREVRRPFPGRTAPGPLRGPRRVGEMRAGGRFDPAYPDACIPPPPPDHDCADVDQQKFTVRLPDPHNFDGDHNGVGSET
jgi:hypothetical protein